MPEGPDVTPEDALQIAQRALAKVNEQERESTDLKERMADLEEDVVALQLRLSEQDEDRPYDSYTLDEKVGMVREHAFEKATASNGYTKLDYDDVMWEVFDGDPGPNHCYKLLRLAAEARGFEYRDPSGESKHLRVDVAEAKRGAAFYCGNKTASEEGSL